MSSAGNIKTEHAGAKNGGGFWGPRTEAKKLSNRARRSADKKASNDPEGRTRRERAD